MQQQQAGTVMTMCLILVNHMQGQVQQTAAATNRDSDDEALDLDQSEGQLLQIATATSRDSDDDVLYLGQSLGQILQSTAATNEETEVIDVDMHACKQPPAPYWIQNLEPCQAGQGTADRGELAN